MVASSDFEMSADGVITKYANEDKAYEFNFSSCLATSESISSYILTYPSGLATGAGTVSNTTSAVQIAVSGGTANINYKIICLATTDTPNTFERAMTIKVRSQ